MEVRERFSSKELFGWCMFDFANSSYTTVIITVILEIYLVKSLFQQAMTPLTQIDTEIFFGLLHLAFLM